MCTVEYWEHCRGRKTVLFVWDVWIWLLHCLGRYANYCNFKACFIACWNWYRSARTCWRSITGMQPSAFLAPSLKVAVRTSMLLLFYWFQMCMIRICISSSSANSWFRATRTASTSYSCVIQSDWSDSGAQRSGSWIWCRWRSQEHPWPQRGQGYEGSDQILEFLVCLFWFEAFWGHSQKISKNRLLFLWVNSKPPFWQYM